MSSCFSLCDSGIRLAHQNCVLKSTLIPTGISDMFPAAWRTKTQTLICIDLHYKNWYSVDLKSSKTIKITQLDTDTIDVVYIPKYDTLIYLKSSWLPGPL